MIAPIEEGVHAVFERETLFRPFEIKAAVLSETKDTRRVVQYSFYSNDEQVPRREYRLVAKFYSDETGDFTFRLMKTLSLLPAESVLTVPAPLFYDADRRLLVMQEADGIHYPELLHKGNSKECMELAGRALSQLHHFAGAPAERKKINDHLVDLIHPPTEELISNFYNYRSLIESAVQTMREKEEQWREHVQDASIHRDFHLKQMFYENGRVWIVDWDLFCKGDPALDLGNFLVYLETHVSENLSRLTNAFLSGYFSNNSASIFRRIWLYKGFTYLRLACKSFRLRQPVERTKEMLDQMEGCFERENH